MKAALLSLLLLSCSLAAAEIVVREQVLMGTFATIKTQTSNSSCIQKAFERIREVEASLSSYKIGSDIYNLNLYGKASISQDTYEALTEALHYFKQSGGYFDISIGSITRQVLDFNNPSSSVDRVKMQNAKLLLDSLELNQTVASIDLNATLDLGGFGKGFGVDKAIKTLKECGADSAVVALSGDIRCLKKCTVSIQNPFGTKSIMRFQTIKDNLAISTSGDYNRFIKTRAQNHLINPKTKTFSTKLASATLISKIKNSTLDAYATAISVMPHAQAIELLESNNIAYILIYSDHKVIKSSNLLEHIKIVDDWL